VLTAWREPRTLVVGLMVLAFAFTEGSANDWIAIAMVDGHGTSETLGAIAFGFFVAAMTAGRMVGGTALERFGRVAVVRATAVIALAGLLLMLLGGSVPVALAGALLWGIGASLGFPVGMSAAADDPARAAARVSVVSSIGYTAFIAGPPLIGLLGEHAGILRALFVVLGALLLGLLAAGSARPLPSRPLD
jgi:MFS family permease